MRTFATTALLLTTMLAFGAAPAAADHGDLQGRRVIALANDLERATDVLLRDARRAAGRVDRYEADALQALHRLEDGVDHLRKEIARRGPFGPHVRNDLDRVQHAYQEAAFRIDAFASRPRHGHGHGRGHGYGHGRGYRHGDPVLHALREDLRQVRFLLARLEESIDGGRRGRYLARDDDWRFRLAYR